MPFKSYFPKFIGATSLVVATAIALISPPAIADEQVFGQASNGSNLTIDMWGTGGSNKSKPAVILFHGGGWGKGSPDKYASLCEDLSKYSVACFTPSYSLTGGEEVLNEASSAVAWVRGNSAKFGINPARIVVAGGSVGGYLAASTALLPSRQGVASIPNALILENPVIVPYGDGPAERLADAIRRPLPPTLIMHGTADTTAPYAGTQSFVAAAKAAGSQTVQLIPYPDRQHGFFNYRGGSNPDYYTANGHFVDFLAALGWITCRSSSGQHVTPGFSNTFDHVSCTSP
jgi:acetyl esterase